MLTDIEGSTRLWQTNRQATARSVRLHDHLVAASIEENHGVVLKDRGEGDSFFAVFPRARDGLVAAQQIQQNIQRQEWPDAAPLRVRIAIHTGEADEELEDDYRGLVVNRCARLRALAHGGQILISSSVHELVRDQLPADLSLRDLGEHRLRDLDRPEHVFLVIERSLRAETADENMQASSAARPTPRPLRQALCPIVVGRDRELRLLREQIAGQPGAGNGVILLAGEAGIGKTRLAEEMQRRAVESGMDVMWGGCSEGELALPYVPIVEAVGNYLANVDLPAVKARLGLMARELSHLFPQLATDGAVPETGDPGQAKLRLFESILALLHTAAEPGRLLLVIEDVHWADASTRELLDYLVRRLPEARTTLLLTYRHGEVGPDHPMQPHLQGWLRGRGAVRIELTPLTARGVSDVVGAIFGQHAATDDFRDYLLSRCDGNPFVLEEMLKSALDRGDIYRTQSGWERKAVADLEIPSTVREVILQRLARLERPEVDIVRTAAVLGDSFAYEAWVAACATDEESVRATLRECVEQQLMEAESDQRFRFRHALTRQAIYEDLLGPERKARHARAVAALRGVPGTPAAEVAHHLVLADQWNEAVPELIRAAEDAETHRGYHEAAELYERARSHVDDQALAGRLTAREGRAWFYAGEPLRAQPLLERGVSQLEALNLVSEAAGYRLTLGSCHFVAGRNDLAKAQYERIRANLEADGPSATLATAYTELAVIALNAMDIESAEKLAELGIRTGAAVGADGPRLRSQAYRGSALVGAGSVDAGLVDLDHSWSEATERGLFDIAGIALSNAILQRALSFRAAQSAPLFDRLNSIPDLVHAGGRLATWVQNRRALTAIVLGEMVTASAAAREGIRLARQADSNLLLIPELTAFLAVAECGVGRTREARELASSVSLPVFADNTEAGWGAMRVWLDLGEMDSAVALAVQATNYLGGRSRLVIFDAWILDKAIEVFLAAHMNDEAARLGLKLQVTAPAAKSMIDRIEGRLAAATGDLERADARLTEAVFEFEACGYRDDEWRTRRALADVNAKRGDLASAARELRLVITEAESSGHRFEGAAALHQLTQLAAV